MWHKQLVYYCFLLLLSLLVCVGCVSKADYDSCIKNSETLQSEVNRLNTELKLYQDTFGKVYEDVEIPYYKLDSSDYPRILPMSTKNNPLATNPTWEQLAQFIARDRTEKIRYWDKPAMIPIPDGELCQCEGNCDYQRFVCSDFAIRLHDNAEAEGIRAAIVIVELEGKENPHALNAFVTTDRGLVYIDCTGEEDCNGHNKVVYLEMGKKIGAIELLEIKAPLAYAWFSELMDTMKEYNEGVDIEELIKTHPNTAAYAIAWSYDLFAAFDSEGIVTNIEIYW
jgi:hypothetical protein